MQRETDKETKREERKIMRLEVKMLRKFSILYKIIQSFIYRLVHKEKA